MSQLRFRKTMEEVISAVAYMNIDQCKALMEKELKWRSDVKSIIFHLCLFYMNGGKKDFTYWKQCSWIIQSASLFLLYKLFPTLKIDTNVIV